MALPWQKQLGLGEGMPVSDSSGASYRSDSESSDAAEFCASILTGIIDNVTTDEVGAIAAPPVIPAAVIDEDINNNQGQTLSDAHLRNMTEWCQFIEPKIDDAVKNSSYDINDYEAEIMDSLSEDKTIPFSKLVEGKSTRDIARFFQSTLQLTTMGNIELANTSPGEIASDLQLLLLPREENSEQLDEYEEPSETANKERFRQGESNQQSSTSQQQGPSSRLSDAQHKKRKFT